LHSGESSDLENILNIYFWIKMNLILFKLIFMVIVVVINYFIKVRSFFKVLIINYKEIEISSSSIDIVCMPIATTQNNISTDSNYKKHFDQIICKCKWQSSGIDYCDNSTTANSDCHKIGFSNGLWNTLYLKNNNFDDQKILEQSISASNFNR
jgi:hypothetical protein